MAPSLVIRRLRAGALVTALLVAGASACGIDDSGYDCIDLDGDGYGNGLDCLGLDCNEQDPTCHTGECCPPDCVDADGDTYGRGADCQGADCNDADDQCWEGACCPLDCVDADGDDYGVGADCLGADCDEGNSGCWEGACCHPNAATCGEIVDCVAACAGSSSCETVCIGYGDSQAENLYDDLALCILFNGCQDSDCVALLCAFELASCENDT